MSVQIRNTGLIRSKAAPLLLSLDKCEQAELLLNHQNVCIYRHYWSVHQLQYVLVTTTTCWNLFKPDAQWSEGDVFCRIGGSCVLRVFCTLGIHCSTHRELYDVRMICWWRVPLIPGLVFFFFFEDVCAWFPILSNTGFLMLEIILHTQHLLIQTEVNAELHTNNITLHHFKQGRTVFEPGLVWEPGILEKSLKFNFVVILKQGTCRTVQWFLRGLHLQSWSDDISSTPSFKVQDVPLLRKHASHNAFKVFQISFFLVTRKKLAILLNSKDICNGQY